MTEIVKGKIVNPYECANIGNDDYTTYPVDAEGKVTQVDVIENGKLLKFITPANAKARMDKQIADNLKVSVDESDESSSDESSSDEPSTTEEQTPVETEPTDKTAESPAGEPEEPPAEGQTETSGKE